LSWIPAAQCGEVAPEWGKVPHIAPGSRWDLQAEQSLEEPQRGVIIINMSQSLAISCRRNSLVVYRTCGAEGKKLEGDVGFGAIMLKKGSTTCIPHLLPKIDDM
jgi:hypothetical protein